VAKELVTKCDKCGQASDDVRTYRLRQDGTVWEMDLDNEHAAEVTVTEMMKCGRATVDQGARRGSANVSRLESLIRSKPRGEQ
jgi:hypothetical protein